MLCSAQDIRQLTVTAGDDVTLPCTVTAAYPSWTGPEIFNGNTMKYNNYGQSSFLNPNLPEQKRTRLDWSSDKSSLIIRDVILTDKGLYQCASVARINLTVRGKFMAISLLRPFITDKIAWLYYYKYVHS